MNNQNSELGRLESVHKIANLYAKRIMIVISVSLVILIIGVILLAGEISKGSTDYAGYVIGSFVCCIIPLMMISISLWSWFIKRKAELRIYEYGLIYFYDGKMQTCFWDQITNIHIDEKEVFSEIKTFVISLEKEDGENIILTEAIEDLPKVRQLIDGKFTVINDGTN